MSYLMLKAPLCPGQSNYRHAKSFLFLATFNLLTPFYLLFDPRELKNIFKMKRCKCCLIASQNNGSFIFLMCAFLGKPGVFRKHI